MSLTSDPILTQGRTVLPTLPIPRRIQYLLALTALLLLTQAIFRLSFWAFISDLPMALEAHLAKAFWIGVRFDLRVALLATLCTLPWLILPKFSAVNYRLLKHGLSLWVAAMLLAIIVVYVIDAGHYLYLDTRLDASVLRFATNLQESSLMVWQSYPVIWITLGVMALWGAVYWIHKHWVLQLLSRQKHAQNWWLRSIAVLLFGALMLLMLLGRWSLVPLRWNHAYFNGNSEVAALGLNPLVWYYDTSKFKKTVTVGKHELEPYLPELEELLGGPFIHNGGSLLDRIEVPPQPVVKSGETPNIAIVFLESLGSSHIGAYGNPLNPTPNIDALIKQSRWYPNFIVPDRSTAKSMFTSLTGIPDVISGSTASRNPYMTSQRSIANHFDAHNKYYMLGGSAGWANMSATISNSIKGVNLLEEQHWQSPVEDVWGINDRDLFIESVNALKQESAPFFAYIQTAANHSPYTIPANVPGFAPTTVTDSELALGYFTSQDQYNAVRLLDHNVKHLIDLFKQEGMYDDTIFVIFADHQAKGTSDGFIPDYITQFNIGGLPVPLIIHAPAYITAETDLTPGNLSDLLPTIAGLFPKPYLNTTLGRDLAWAKGKNLPTYGTTSGHISSVVFNQNIIASQNHQTGEQRAALIQSNTQTQDIDIESEEGAKMLRMAQAYYLASHYLLTANVEKR